MENVEFWAIAAILGLGVAALLWLSAARASAPQTAEPAPDLQVYRDQMKGMERDLARGTIPADEAERLRQEIGRRLIEADRTARRLAGEAARRGSLLPIAAAILAALIGAFLLYQRLGAPGYPDLPLADRLAAADARMEARPDQAAMLARIGTPPGVPEAQIPEADLALIRQLRAAVDPASASDPTGLELLAATEARLGNWAVAITAQERLIAVRSDAATGSDFATLADLLIGQASGYVSPEAEAALIEALRREPENGLARYYAGLLFAQNDRADRAFALWRPLLESPPEGERPWDAALREQIVEVAALAGTGYTPPEATRGPTLDDIAGAEAMSPEDRAAMIEGMVESLTSRLQTQGGSIEEWLQLVNALRVLGRSDEADATLTEARLRFQGSEAALRRIEAAEAAQ